MNRAMATPVSVPTPVPAIRIQNWGDDLRLPSFTHTAAPDTNPLLEELSPHRKTVQPFQSRHLASLKRNQWFALRRPTCRSRTGLLVVWPAKACCVFVAPPQQEQKAPYAHRKTAPRLPPSGIAILRLRVDPQFYAPGTGLTVFAATLSASSRHLWLEDVILWKGRSVATSETFTARSRLMKQWLEHYCIVDTKLLGGLRLELARWQPLDAMKPEGVWELLADDAGARHLLWIARGSDRTPTLGPERPSPLVSAALEDDTIQLIPAVTEAPAPAAAVEHTGPLIAVATREAGGPELWSLTSAEGGSLGRALIRKMAVSSALRNASGKTIRVEVVWVPSFAKWEVTGLAIAGTTATHGSVFTAESRIVE